MKKNKIKNFTVIMFLSFSSIFYSCRTIDFDKQGNSFKGIKEETVEIEADEEISIEADSIQTISKEKKTEPTQIINLDSQENKEDNNFEIFVESEPQIEFGLQHDEASDFTGTEALKKNLQDIQVPPVYKDNHLQAWKYQKGKIFQIHTQTYHSTLIQFEPGETMLEVPYLSETDVWRISRGVGIENGMETQFLIIKPDYSGLCSTLIVITNRRVYQMELTSYKDHYMPFVEWSYSKPIIDSDSWKTYEKKETEKKESELQTANDAYISTNYAISYVFWHKPSWCPTQVYDNGQKTYIILDKKVLNMAMPTIFLNGKEVVNKEFKKNVIIVNQLVEKLTLRLGKETIVIKKKKGI